MQSHQINCGRQVGSVWPLPYTSRARQDGMYVWLVRHMLPRSSAILLNYFSPFSSPSILIRTVVFCFNICCQQNDHSDKSLLYRATLATLRLIS